MSLSSQPGPEWSRNPGYCPEDAKGKRVAVILANGKKHGETPAATAVPAGWAVDRGKGQPGVRWSRTGDPYDVDFYRVL